MLYVNFGKLLRGIVLYEDVQTLKVSSTVVVPLFGCISYKLASPAIVASRFQYYFFK
jgi:hypothetical protein